QCCQRFVPARWRPPCGSCASRRDRAASGPLKAFTHNSRSVLELLSSTKVSCRRVRIALGHKIAPPRRLSDRIEGRWRIPSSRHPCDEEMPAITWNPFAFLFPFSAMLVPLELQLFERPTGKFGLDDRSQPFDIAELRVLFFCCTFSF